MLIFTARVSFEHTLYRAHRVLRALPPDYRMKAPRAVSARLTVEVKGRRTLLFPRRRSTISHPATGSGWRLQRKAGRRGNRGSKG